MTEEKADWLFFLIITSAGGLITLIMLGITILSIVDGMSFAKPLVGFVAGCFMTLVFFNETQKKKKALRS